MTAQHEQMTEEELEALTEQALDTEVQVPTIAPSCRHMARSLRRSHVSSSQDPATYSQSLSAPEPFEQSPTR